MSDSYKRLPVPAHAGKPNRYENRYDKDEVPPEVGPIVTALIFGGGGIAFGVAVAPLLFLLLILPVIHFVFLGSQMRSSNKMYAQNENTGDLSLYYKGILTYRDLYDPEHRAEALPLLEKIYEHETVLSAIKKSHKIGRYGDADCKPCANRVELMRKSSFLQPVPETETYDIDHFEAILEVKKEMLAITSGKS